MHEKIYSRSDFTNTNEVRWCPGCGDYAILAAIQKLLPELGIPPEQHVFISGIGCAGRLPYYMNTYGFHTIHGRALAVATGLKAMNDSLCVWVITGDGDALSIGGNHFLHCLRRNVDVKILLFNNQVYGLTKGQFSPTSKCGQITKTSPNGVDQKPINPLVLALSAGASFVARAVDKDPNQLKDILKAAYYHKGSALVEIYQDCHIFNEGAFDEFTLKNNRAENTVQLVENMPLIFGKDANKMLIVEQDKCVIVNNSDKSSYVHCPSDLTKATRLALLSYPEYPVPLGIYYQEQRACLSYNHAIKKTPKDLELLYRKKASWSQK